MYMSKLRELDRNILSFWKGIPQSILGWNRIKINTMLFNILDVSVGYVSTRFTAQKMKFSI